MAYLPYRSKSITCASGAQHVGTEMAVDVSGVDLSLYYSADPGSTAHLLSLGAEKRSDSRASTFTAAALHPSASTHILSSIQAARRAIPALAQGSLLIQSSDEDGEAQL